jgi:hypothetical protein
MRCALFSQRYISVFCCAPKPNKPQSKSGFGRGSNQKEEETKKQTGSMVEEKTYIARRYKVMIELSAKTHEDKVKGMMNGEGFVLLTGTFKKERTRLKYQEQQLQGKLEAAKASWVI